MVTEHYSMNSTARSVRIGTSIGDSGKTSLYSGEYRRKYDPIFFALGDIDELCCSIGLSRYYCKEAGLDVDHELKGIQLCLMGIGSHVANPATSNESKIERTRFDIDGRKTSDLENFIEHYKSYLPELHSFLVPNGVPCTMFLHQCRSICRRTERSVLLVLEVERMDFGCLRYLNRLSDHFFALARYSALHHGETEVTKDDLVGN